MEYLETNVLKSEPHEIINQVKFWEYEYVCVIGNCLRLRQIQKLMVN